MTHFKIFATLEKASHTQPMLITTVCMILDRRTVVAAVAMQQGNYGFTLKRSLFLANF